MVPLRILRERVAPANPKRILGAGKGGTMTTGQKMSLLVGAVLAAILLGAAVLPIEGPTGRSCGRALSQSGAPLLYQSETNLEKAIVLAKNEGRRLRNPLSIGEVEAERTRLSELRVFGCANELSSRRSLLVAAVLPILVIAGGGWLVFRSPRRQDVRTVTPQ